MSNPVRAGKGGCIPGPGLAVVQLVAGTGTQRLLLSGSYERASLRARRDQPPSPPVSSPSWLPAFGPAAARSGQRGVARTDGPASTAASARTCRWGIAEVRVRACWGDGVPGAQG